MDSGINAQIEQLNSIMEEISNLIEEIKSDEVVLIDGSSSHEIRPGTKVESPYNKLYISLEYIPKSLIAKPPDNKNDETSRL